MPTCQKETLNKNEKKLLFFKKYDKCGEPTELGGKYCREHGCIMCDYQNEHKEMVMVNGYKICDSKKCKDKASDLSIYNLKESKSLVKWHKDLSVRLKAINGGN